MGNFDELQAKKATQVESVEITNEGHAEAIAHSEKMAQIISRYNLKLKVHQGESFKDVFPEAHRQLETIPVEELNPEIRDGVVHELVTRGLLAEDKEYQSTKSEQIQHEAQLQASEAAEKMLPEYLAFLNDGFFSELFGQIDELDDPRIQRAIWENPELRKLEALYEIDYKDKKIIELKSKDSLPTAQEMQQQMSSSTKPWDQLGNFSHAINALKQLKHTRFEDFQIVQNKVFNGNMEGAVLDLVPKETISREEPNAQAFEQRGAVLAKAESSAAHQAQEFVQYVSLRDDLRSMTLPEVHAEQERTRMKLEALQISASRLAGEAETQFRIEDDHIINVAWEEKKSSAIEKKSAAEREKAKLEVERATLGPKPEGLLNGKKRETWEATHGRLTRSIAELTEFIGGMENSHQNIQDDWSSNLNLPPELLKSLEGSTVYGKDLSENVRAEIKALQPKGAGLAQEASILEDKSRRLAALERTKFETR